MYELVNNTEEIFRNIAVFNKELAEKDCLIRKLSSFQHWYFVKELNAFGPSKFIGYKGNSAEIYREGTHRYMGCMDGRDTVKLFERWFRKASEVELEQLMPNLVELLNKYGKVPNKRVTLHVEK